MQIFHWHTIEALLRQENERKSFCKANKHIKSTARHPPPPRPAQGIQQGLEGPAAAAVVALEVGPGGGLCVEQAGEGGGGGQGGGIGHGL